MNAKKRFFYKLSIFIFFITSSIYSKNKITFGQSVWNELPFRGISVFGEGLSRRNNTKYKSFYQAWHLTSSLSFTTPIKNLAIGFNVYSPLTARTNKDNDFFFQTEPGGDDLTNEVVSALNSGTINFDPNAIKQRKEKNARKDITDATILYTWKTRYGAFKSGFYFANNHNAHIHLGELITGWEAPFLKKLNPSYIAYFRFTSSGTQGLNNGNSNHRLSISYKLYKKRSFKLTASLSAGYQVFNNNTDKRSGVSDITPLLTINYSKFFINIMDWYRPDTRLYDTSMVYPNTGVYENYNKNDGKVPDPSKVHGIRNKFVTEQIATAVDNAGIAPFNDITKRILTQNYQEQKIIRHNIMVNVGYSITF